MNTLYSEAMRLLGEVSENLEMTATEYAKKVNCKEEEEGSTFRLDADTAWYYRSGYAKTTVYIAIALLKQLGKEYEFVER